MRLRKQILIHNNCYTVGRTIRPAGVMVHSTGANNPRVSRYVPGDSVLGVNTGGNHANLNDDYASVPAEMKKVASYFGKSVLREVTLDEILANIPKLREFAGDRAIMRAIHFENENERVVMQTEALRRGDLDAFFAGVMESGNSSFKYLQNVYTVKNVKEQGLSLALCLTDMALHGKRAAWRVHGGGFAGTIQAFVAEADVEHFKTSLESAFGKGSVTILKVRPYGAIRII